ncbi:MAG TPA: amidase [Candidatus Eisenbacteria bacterium]|nr:amidase [Candidatus Eisenbacteria bacterium]
MDIAHRSTTALAAALRGREIGCRELLDHYLGRIERMNPGLNAVVTLDVERARRRADEADAALARGETWGPLHGVPMTIKDTYETAGMRTTCGWSEIATHVPERDAEAVARLRAAGAVIFGKTNVPTLASDVQTFNPIFGTTNNPWNVGRTPGGSSGGAAAALAAGLTGFELGSDIGGSIRTPAGWCGVYGHKPTWGIVPGRGHIPGPPGRLAEDDLGVFGPLARGVDDLDLGLDVLVGPGPEDARAWRIELPPPRRDDSKAYRFAAWLDDPAFPVDGEVRTLLETAVAALRRAGARVDDRARPRFDFADAVRTYHYLLNPIILAGMPDDGFENLVQLAASFPPDDDGPLARSARAATIRHRDWLRLHERRKRIQAAFADFFRQFDVLLMPIVPVAAIPHDHSDPFPARTIMVNDAAMPYMNLFTWIGPATMAHLPATSAPIGRTPGGLPVGIQIVGPYLEDRTPIDVARRLGAVVGGFTPPPGFA